MDGIRLLHISKNYIEKHKNYLRLHMCLGRENVFIIVWYVSWSATKRVNYDKNRLVGVDTYLYSSVSVRKNVDTMR